MMDELLRQVLAGLATGGIYASLALALVMIYQATHLVNFAQGELAMFATYIAWSLINAGMPYWPAFLITVGFAFVLGVVIERSESRRGLVEERMVLYFDVDAHAPGHVDIVRDRVDVLPQARSLYEARCEHGSAEQARDVTRAPSSA